jgi:hypothetical protein
MAYPIYKPVGDSGVLVSYENRICADTNEKTQLLADNIERSSPYSSQVGDLRMKGE